MKHVAYHEAAHAVAGAILLKHFAPVSINGKSGEYHGGKIEIATLDQYSRWNMVVLCIAGPYAEARVMKRARWQVLLAGGVQDSIDAEDLLDWLIDNGYSKSMDAAWEYVEAVTPTFLRKHWPAIERVAAGLLQHGSLDASEVARLATMGGAIAVK